MSELVLTLRSPLDERIDLSPLVPDRLASVAPADIARLTLRLESGGRAAVGDLFSVSGGPSGSIRVVGDLSRGDDLGRGMSHGVLAIEGAAGRCLGARMTGGRIEVAGSAGDRTGLEMAGGQIVVRGSVGRAAGSASAGSKRGMAGGEIIVFGNAGAETGACLRRGLIAVTGNVGPDAARAAIAGTVLIGGNAAPPVGRWLKRATVVVLGEAIIPPTYRYACTFRPPYVGLVLTHLRRTYGFPVSPDQAVGRFHCCRGDFAETGRGEILCRARQ